MTKSALTHLHGHSAFSNVLGPDALCTPDALVKRAADMGLDAICLTDHASVSGVPSFAKACEKAGLKPIVGAELYVCLEAELGFRPTKENPFKTSWHLLALARSWDGLLELFQLLTTANSAGRFYRRPRNTLEDLYDTKHLVFTTACMGGILIRDDWQLRLAELHSHVGRDRLFLEIQAHDHDQQRLVNSRAVAASRDLGLRLIAAQDFHYAEHGQHIAHECMINIGTGYTIADPNRRQYGTDQLFITSAEEMLGAFYQAHILPGHLDQADVLRAIINTRAVAEQLDFKWQNLPVSLPAMAANPEATLMGLCLDGLAKKGLDTKLEYLQRLKYEFGVLQATGFLNYFLLLHDIVAWARSQGIMVGPGRGSAAGSLVSYTLGITSVDPIEHRMMFERFHRPGRLDLPDIDTDFEDARRDEVLAYITGKFGVDHVSKISNWNTLAARGAIKDAARVLNIDHNIVNGATRQCTDYKASDDEVMEHQAIVSLFNANPGLEALARSLCGVMRGVGEHASGIIVAGVPLRERGVLQQRQGGMQAIGWDMRQAEQVGLMKLDVLGLRTLQILRRTNDNLRAAGRAPIDFEALPLTDPNVLNLFNEGQTVSVFQFESHGIRRALKEVGVTSFEDVVVVNALYRPGPMDLIPLYADGKRNPAGVHYVHASMRPALESTYGVMVYQEQTMMIAKDVAGFSWEAVDKLRKAVGKKLPDEMAKLRADFVAGCQATSGFDEHTAEFVWNQIEKFAGYGFNRSHAVCYSVIAYWTAYCKVYYPTEFFAAVLTATTDDDTKRAAVDDATKRGVTITPPNVNDSSDVSYIPHSATRRIMSPLTAIKGLGEKAAEVIVATRLGLMDSRGLRAGEQREEGVKNKTLVVYDAAKASAGPYMSKANLQARVYGRVVNKKIMELLEACGALPGEAGDETKKAELLSSTMQVTVDLSKPMDEVLTGLVQSKLQEVIIHQMAPAAYKPPVLPVVGSHPRIMIVLDKPEYQDEPHGELCHGDGFDILRKILLDVCRLKRPDLYVTSLYRFYDPPIGYAVQEENSNKLIEFEVKSIKPPLVLACGAGPIKLFSGGKGVGQMHGQMCVWNGVPVLCLINPIQAKMDISKLPELKQAIVDNMEALCGGW